MTLKTAVGAGLALVLAQAGFAAAPWYRNFELGAGCYGGPAGGTDLDVARTSWSYLGLGNVAADMSTVQYLNRLFAMNPKHKVVIRLWPKPGYHLPKDDPKSDKRYITHFAYKYHPEAREAFLKECRAELDIFLKNVTHPQNIYGYTLFEELPHQFGGDVSLLDKMDPKTPLGEMWGYAAEYRKEFGKELTEWNEDARRWWGKTFAWSLRDVYATLKKEYPQLHGFVYFMSHYRPLDWLNEGEPVHSHRIIPCQWSDLVEPGVAADGFFAYCNNARWTERYQKLAKDHHWPYFSQLSHTSNMRIATWQECLDIGNSPIPENLGYFYYEWDFSYGWWNDDPDVPEEDRDDLGSCGDPDMVSRFRQHFAKIGLNEDIVKRYLKPTVVYSHELGPEEVNSYAMATATIVNDRDVKWFRNAEDAVMRNVKAKLVVPKEFSIPDTVSCPPEVTIPRIAPGEHKVVMWWVRRDKASDPEKMVSSVTVTAEGVEPVTATSEKGVDNPIPQDKFPIRRSGDRFTYVNWGHSWAEEPVEITLRPNGGALSCVIDPAVEHGLDRLIWRGELPNNKCLVLGPGKKATLTDMNGKNPVDVSDQLMGRPLKIGKGVSVFTYTDNYRAGVGAKLTATVRPVPPEPKKK